MTVVLICMHVDHQQLEAAITAGGLGWLQQQALLGAPGALDPAFAAAQLAALQPGGAAAAAKQQAAVAAALQNSALAAAMLASQPGAVAAGGADPMSAAAAAAAAHAAATVGAGDFPGLLFPAGAIQGMAGKSQGTVNGKGPSSSANSGGSGGNKRSSNGNPAGGPGSSGVGAGVGLKRSGDEALGTSGGGAVSADGSLMKKRLAVSSPELPNPMTPADSGLTDVAQMLNSDIVGGCLDATNPAFEATTGQS